MPATRSRSSTEQPAEVASEEVKQVVDDSKEVLAGGEAQAPAASAGVPEAVVESAQSEAEVKSDVVEVAASEHQQVPSSEVASSETSQAQVTEVPVAVEAASESAVVDETNGNVNEAESVVPATNGGVREAESVAPATNGGVREAESVVSEVTDAVAVSEETNGEKRKSDVVAVDVEKPDSTEVPVAKKAKVDNEESTEEVAAAAAVEASA